MGWVYNLKDPNAPTSAPRLIAIAIAFSILATLAICLRFGVRARTGKTIGLDDWAAAFSWVWSL